MTSIEHYGQSLTEETVKSALHQAALGQADVPMALHPMSGTQWITQLIDSAGGTPLETTVDDALSAVLQTGGSAVMEVLFAVAQSRPGHIPSDVLLAAIQEQSHPPERQAKAMRGLLLSGSMAYSQDLRALAEDPDALEAFAAVYLCFDHAWTMEQLGTWFSGDAAADRSLLLGLLSKLSRGELHALAAEVDGGESGVPEAVAEQITAYAAEMADRPFFADRGDAVRWLSD